MTRVDERSIPDAETVERVLRRAFDGSPNARRVVARQVVDLVESGQLDRDRGYPTTLDHLVDDLRDAPHGSSLPSRWNWWLGSLEVAYGGYEPFQVRRVVRD